MEARLKDDIMREAERYQGAIMVIHETDDGQIFDSWEHVSSDAVQTPVEVFKCLEADGFPIKYARVPITDGKAPKSSDFDVLSLNIASASKDTAFVFNCQVTFFTLLVFSETFDSKQMMLILLISANTDGYREDYYWNCNCLSFEITY